MAGRLLGVNVFEDRRQTISVCLPAKDEESTIGQALAPLMQMRRDGYIDQVVVVDESTDWTADIAQSMGAEVHRQSALLPELGPVVGKGDALYRALSILTGDILLFLDADSISIQRHYLFAMCAPLLEDRADMVKGFYRRPLGADPDGGGRVNHLLARPLLRAWFPDLEWVRQPLAGETAIRRDVAMLLPFFCGYAVEIGLLLDAYRRGFTIRQVDLHLHDHRHRPLGELGGMADEIIAAVHLRARVGDSREYRLVERPPMADYIGL